ncbi:MAG: hypothetical protein RLZZ618_1096 [Pseudomonadota bacterium]|jgi:outer membrane PBP1 activator LpoA protein
MPRDAELLCLARHEKDIVKRPLLLPVLVAATLLAACSKSPESTAESFFKALSAGEITEAQTYLSSEVTSLLGPKKAQAGLTQEAKRIQACGGIKDIDLKLTGQGQLRTGSATIVYAGSACKTKDTRVNLIKEEGQWKIGAGK